MSIWLFVAGAGALVLSMGLFGIAKNWQTAACALTALVIALGLLVLATEQADQDRVQRCKDMGGLWHPVDESGICITPDGKVLFSG